MKRLWAIAGLAAVALAVWLARRDAGRSLPELRRPAFPLPEATPDERSAYFLDLLDRAESWRLGGWSAPVGRVLGEAGLLGGGTASLDYLLSEARTPEYMRSPTRLLTLLKLLADFPRAREHPRYEPFLRYWLDPANCPPDTPGSRPAEEYRKRIFHLFRIQPPEWAVPYCVAELTRRDRHHDLRVEALGVLLYLGRTEPIAAHWAELPPTEAESKPLLKQFVLTQMRAHAQANQPPARRAGARRLEPLAREALAHGDPLAQVNAASTLLRLGDETMVDRLLELFEAARAEDEKDVAWSALQQLVEDRADPRIRGICLERVAGPPDTGDFTYRTALQILAYAWLDDDEVRAKLWAYVDAVQLHDLAPLQWLLGAPDEREKVVAVLRDAIRGDDIERCLQAVRFATHPNNPMPEVMPDLFEVARKTPADRGRTRFLNALVTMRFRPVVPLLLADLGDDLAVLRRAAAANLLEVGGDECVVPVAKRLEEGDRELLAPIVARAQARGADGVDPALLPALLRTLKTAPGEEDRMRALYALRCRGVLEGVEAGLMDAYRREPSRRVADAIRETLVELAYRS